MPAQPADNKPEEHWEGRVQQEACLTVSRLVGGDRRIARDRRYHSGADCAQEKPGGAQRKPTEKLANPLPLLEIWWPPPILAPRLQAQPAVNGQDQHPEHPGNTEDQSDRHQSSDQPQEQIDPKVDCQAGHPRCVGRK